MADLSNLTPAGIRRKAHELVVYLAIGFGFYSLNGADKGSCNTAFLAEGCLLVFALILQLLSLTSKEAEEEYPSYVLWAMAAAFLFGLYVLAQALVTGHYPIWRSLITWIEYCAFGIVLLPIVSYTHSLRRLMLVMSAIALCAALFGIAQRFTGTWNVAGADLRFAASGSFGIFYYENSYGAYAALLLPLMASVLIHRLTRHDPDTHHSVSRIAGFFVRGGLNTGAPFLVIALCVMVVGFFFSGARFGLLAVTAVYLMAALLLMSFRGKLISASIAAAAGAALVFGANSGMIGKTLKTFQWHLLAESAAERIENTRSALQIFVDHPWTGRGMGMFAFVSPSYMNSGGDSFYVWTHYNHAHNSFIDLLTEGGIIGCVLAVTIVSLLVIPPILARHEQESSFRRMMRTQAILALISFGLTLLSDSLLRIPIIVMHFVIQLGILARSSHPYLHGGDCEGPSVPLRKIRPAIAGVGCFIVICLVVVGGNLAFQYRIHEVSTQNMPQEQRMVELTRIDPDNPERQSEHAATYQKMARETRGAKTRGHLLDRAFESAARAAELMPFYAPYQHQMGWILYDQGDAAGAIEKFKRAIQLAPQNVKFKTDLLLIDIFEAKKTASIIRRSQLSVEARELYESIKSSPAVSTHGIETLAVNAEQRKYLTDFIRLMTKYEDELKNGATGPS